MTDERFDRLMRHAGESYNRPPDDPPLEQMWATIEQARSGIHPFPIQRQRIPAWQQPWLRAAAILILGIAVGRASAGLFAPRSESTEAPSVAAEPVVPKPYQSETDQYLGQAAALLIALPGELNARRGADSSFLSRADDLLLQTRLLLDSPAAQDPALRTLFEDLEVVLVQVVRLPSDRNPVQIDLLQQQLEQRDVLPRLREAVVDHISD